MFSLVYNHLNDCVFVRRSRSSMVSATLFIYREECRTLMSFVESSGNTQNVLDNLAFIGVNKNAGAKSLSVCVRCVSTWMKSWSACVNSAWSHTELVGEKNHHHNHWLHHKTNCHCASELQILLCYYSCSCYIHVDNTPAVETAVVNPLDVFLQ